MAEALFKKFLADNFAGNSVSGIDVTSAGLHACVGTPASAYARTVAMEKGTDVSRHRSKPMTDHLAFSATWLVAMTSSHADELKERFPFARDKVHSLGEFLHQGRAHDIIDPFGGSLADYRECAVNLESSFPGLAKYILG